jgi:hypothetical protein
LFSMDWSTTESREVFYVVRVLTAMPVRIDPCVSLWK